MRKNYYWIDYYADSYNSKLPDRNSYVLTVMMVR